MPDDETIEILLAAWRQGSLDARDELFSRVQGELRELAGGFMRGQSEAHTLEPTALVNEACLRLCGADVASEDRQHFLRLAAKSMRQILVDHARRKNAFRRSVGQSRVPLDEVIERYEERSMGLVDLDAVLARLSKHSPELVEFVELRFFAGLPIEEIASLMKISPRSAARRWSTARAILFDELHHE